MKASRFVVGVAEHLLDLGQALAEHRGDVLELLVDVRGVRLGEDRADRRGDHLLVALGHDREDVAHEVHPASLPRGADEHRADRGLQTGVGIAGDQLHPGQATGLQRAQERGPKRPVLRIADLEPEQFTAPVSSHTSGDHHRLGDHPAVDPGLAVGGVEEHIGVGDLGQRPVPERADLLIEVRTDPRDLGLGDPGVGTERFDQVIDLPRRDPVQVGLHDHREQRLVDPSATLEQAGEDDPVRSLGIRNSRSPAVVVSVRFREPLRCAVR